MTQRSGTDLPCEAHNLAIAGSTPVAAIKWSLLRALAYFFGNRDVAEELARLRSEAYELRERLLEQRRIRGLSQPVDRVETQKAEPDDGYENWREKREREILEEAALPAAKDDIAFEQLEYFASVDPEQWNEMLVEATRIRAEIAKGTYREPQER